MRRTILQLIVVLTMVITTPYTSYIWAQAEPQPQQEERLPVQEEPVFELQQTTNDSEEESEVQVPRLEPIVVEESGEPDGTDKSPAV